MKLHAARFLALLTATVHAGPRTSASYNVATDAADAGGKRATSAAYTNDGSLGGIVGISTVAAPAETAKHGYIGQLYDVTGLIVSGAASVNETATLQLAAWQFLDDTTFLAVPAVSVTWGVVSGPITGVSGAGLATVGSVYQNTPATVQGALAPYSASLNFTVLNTIADNFGSYAGDGVGDDWQVLYFGQNNPNAAPNVDPDGDGQTNLFEFIAGIVPIDPNSRFTLISAAVPGQPGHKTVTFAPRLTDRIYVVKSKPDLSTATWDPLTSFTVSDNLPLQQRTVTDLSATGAKKFYHIEITKP